MIASRMIPMIWLRLIILLGFAGYLAFQGSWWIVVIVLVLAAASGWQLKSAYAEKYRSVE